jgi:hypothetical protein
MTKEDKTAASIEMVMVTAMTEANRKNGEREEKENGDREWRRPQR